MTSSSATRSARTILHVDMDAFYVSVELRRRPELRGKPVVVGGTGPRGVIAAASYEARRYGVHSAMPIDHGEAAVPARGVPARRPRSVRVGQRRGQRHLHVDHAAGRAARRSTRRSSTSPAALRLLGPGAAIAADDPRRVWDELAAALLGRGRAEQVPRQAGVGGGQAAATPTASAPGMGVVEVLPGSELAFLHPLPVQALWGVGPATLQRLQRLGVHTVARPRRARRADAGRLRRRGARPAPVSTGVGRRRAAGRARPGDEVDRPRGDVRRRPAHPRTSCVRELVRLADAVAGAAAGARRRGAHPDAEGALRRLRDDHPIGHRRRRRVDRARDRRGRRAAAARPSTPSPGVRLLGVSASNFASGSAAAEPRRSARRAPRRRASVAARRRRPSTRSASDSAPPRSVRPAPSVTAACGSCSRGAQQWGPDDARRWLNRTRILRCLRRGIVERCRKAIGQEFAMPLSEDEQRILRQIEEQLQRDPSFGRDIKPRHVGSRRAVDRQLRRPRCCAWS